MRALLLVLLLLVPGAALAQSQATLIADRVVVEGNDTLAATGNVEVLYNGSRLTASQITYDRATDQLFIQGPIRVTEGDQFIILADQAQLDPDLQNGILSSARLVLDQQLQLAAAEIHRVNGRYTQLYRTVASSCHVCAKNPVPLWQIRAERIIHDQQERQLYFDNARFEVVGVPVFYLPRLRLPDPTLKRSTGFLLPELRTTSRLGTGIKVPYFFEFGPHRDLTLTPYVSSRTRTLEYRWRQAFKSGQIHAEGAFTDDDIRPGLKRGYLFLDGIWALPRDFQLTFDVETTSDDAYLLEYGYSDKDRLDSQVKVSRTRRSEDISAALIHYKTLRASEDDDTIPSIVGDFRYEKTYKPASIGGTLGFVFEAHSHYRRSNLDVDSADADTIVDGRDVNRASLTLDWRNRWVMTNGIEFSALTEINADYYGISQDAAQPSSVSRVTPFAAVAMRWPWSKTTASGVAHVIEPMVQIVYSDDTGQTVPNEDSTRFEFDEGNLFSLSRFPGRDVYERGLRANIGLTWTRYDPAGWSLGLTVGRILRERNLGQFNTGSGLEGDSSDWLAAAHLNLGGGLTLMNRALFDDNFSFSKNEVRLEWVTERGSLSSSYTLLRAETGVSTADTSEWALAGSYQFGRHWTGKVNWNYDFNNNSATSAGLGLVYATECVEVDLSLARRFTSSTSLTPETNFTISVGLAGVGNARRVQRKRSACYG